MKLIRSLILVLLVTLSALPTVALEFEILNLPNLIPSSFDLSYDGTRAVVHSQGSLYLLDEAGNFTSIGTQPELPSGGFGISGDGKTVIGTIRDSENVAWPALWRESTNWGMELIPIPAGFEPCDLFRGAGYALNGNGTKAVGLIYDGCDAQGFMWTESTGTVPIGPIRASTISQDGTTIGGFDHGVARRPVYWDVLGTSASSPTLLHHELDIGEVYDITSNGQTMVGGSIPYGADPSITGYDAYVYSLGDTNMTLLGTLSGTPSDICRAQYIADNGVIMGISGPSNTVYEAFVWTPEIGMTSLEQYLRDAGITGMAATIGTTRVSALSNNGRTLIGQYNDLLGGWGYFRVKFDAASAVPTVAPASLRLTSASPNPFNPKTKVSFVVDQAQRAKISVYDMAGRRVAVLADRDFSAGEHAVTWQGTNAQGRAVSSGSYLVKLESESGSDTRTITLLK